MQNLKLWKWAALPALTLTTLLPTGLLPTGTEKSEGIDQLVARAETLLQHDEKEDAALLLGEAWRRLGRDEQLESKQRAKLHTHVQRMLRRADTHALSRLKLARKTANDLERIAMKYRDAGWLSTAAEVLQQAEVLDPGRARKTLRELRAAAPKADPNAELFASLQDGMQPYGALAWNQQDDYLESPARLTTTALLLSRKHVIGDANLHVEIEMPAGESRAGLAFAASADGKDYYFVELIHRAFDTAMYLRHWKDGALSTVTMSAASLAPDVRTGFIPIDIRIRGKEIEIQVADASPFRGFVKDPLDGQVGVFVPRNTPVAEPVRFRHLVIREE